MATEPRTIKIQLKHEHTEGISERYPTTSVTYLITASEAQIMVECDLHLRRQEVADPEQAERRSLHEICDELGKHDYNNAKQHLRNTTYRSVSAKDDDDEIPVIDAVASSAEDPRSRGYGRDGEASMRSLDQMRHGSLSLRCVRPWRVSIRRIAWWWLASICTAIPNPRSLAFWAYLNQRWRRG
ncbi:RNA polymerase factor sigma 70 [Corynebacterium pseudotuberculosis P54B96]|nr:RNA polymerase factor sigma 70 [Corynebacterium pseudotuberculosis PAT10]AFF22606.1 RNA polymerase factor sigma 70 [Corynebacterium pseudotuberculosis P54B96]ALU17884.1 RNA polymerase subunit sigma [Corynebacterium pseudotuberculosis]RKT30229.1 hypothetical protein C8E98_2043 [Corynebacterium pseudotuberculosis]VTQ76411.1 RNA polymerase factor sigma 70 [Corynebacterium pseudotuberculosis]